MEERFAPEERSRPRDRVAEASASASASASGGGGFVDYDRLARVAVDVAEEMSVAETRDGSPPGAILAFLPGAPEIERAEKAVRAAFEKHLFSGPGPRRRNGKKTPVPRGGGDDGGDTETVVGETLGDGTVLVVPLHGGLTAEAQRRAFAPAPAGSRKVVLSTNVAETSVTIPDVAAVIDTGRVKRLRRDPSVPGVASLREGWCSRASATQRMGRAGRVREGLCVRLYPRSVFEREMRDRDPPELLDAPLDAAMLRAVEAFPGQDPRAFLRECPDPPNDAALDRTLANLEDIGAVELIGKNAEEEEEDAAKTARRSAATFRGKNMTSDSAAGSHPRGFALTPLGAHLAKLPVEPRVGKMLVYACALGCAPSALVAAAAMTCKPAFVARGPDASDKHAATAAKRLASDEAGGASDHLAIARAYARWRESPAEATRTYSLARGTMRDVASANPVS